MMVVESLSALTSNIQGNRLISWRDTSYRCKVPTDKKILFEQRPRFSLLVIARLYLKLRLDIRQTPASVAQTIERLV